MITNLNRFGIVSQVVDERVVGSLVSIKFSLLTTTYKGNKSYEVIKVIKVLCIRTSTATGTNMVLNLFCEHEVVRGAIV